MKPKLNINESFICRLWEGGNKYYSCLADCNGEDIEILDYGRRNYDSGPDYENAKVKIGTRTLAGDIEIHREFSSWAEHNHPKDRKYNSVILQVVMWDAEVKTTPKLRIKRTLPTVILANFLNRSIHEIWQEIISEPSESFRLPCYNPDNAVTDETLYRWFGKLSLERLKIKTDRIKSRLKELSNVSSLLRGTDSIRKKALWEQVMYEFIFEALGYSKNKEQMKTLAENNYLIRFKALLKNRLNNRVVLQSVLFGSAGMLFDVRLKDNYIQSVKNNWKLAEGRGFAKVLNRSEWNFFRMRPPNFPTIRLAYGSQLIEKLVNDELFKKVIYIFSGETISLKKAYKELFAALAPEIDDYWQNHYDFGKKSGTANKLLGRQRINDIIVNVIIPLVNLYGSIFSNSLIIKNSLTLYNNFKITAVNSVVKVIYDQVIINGNVKSRKVKINSPAMEQAAVQLYNFYCIRERCSECDIGKSVLRDTGFEYKILYY